MMNPALKKLGFGEQDRVVIIHTDDIGMCQATLPAYKNLVDFGSISSASAMIPCPWFPEVAQFCRTHPEKVDMGVHLTLNAEWDTYRWGPISTHDTASGLLDEQGYFFSTTERTVQHADPNAVAIELKAQLERALAAGIDVTHLDSHMGTVMAPPFLQHYAALALEYRLPLFLFKGTPDTLTRYGVAPNELAGWLQLTQELEERGMPLFDAMAMLPLHDPTDHVARAKKLFAELQPGSLTYMILHPTVDSPEIRACAPDWESRVANYAAFSSSELRDYLKQAGVSVIGYRPLRDLVRSTLV
jgi:predicted glycoside hydrolase/deacetylase ChbG (UPF0249 family)